MNILSSNKYHVFFSNLSNPLKVDVVSALRAKNMSVNEMSKVLKIEQSNLSHALSDLRDCSMVTFERKGKEKIYSLNKKTLIPILKLIDAHAKAFCNGNCKFCNIHT